MSPPFEIIHTPERLHQVAGRLRQEASVALDTEFVWEKTYYAQLGLVQAGLSDGACFLIDAVAIPDLSPLADVLTDARIVKILHDAPQDLMILRRATGAAARNVFDTRVAAGFAGSAATISLGQLLADVLGIQLAKAHTRADWTARPLAPEVLMYATEDVVHLPELAARLRERARQAGVEAWLDEERAALDSPDLTAEKSPADAWQRIRVMPPLPPRGLAVLRELAAWREEQARRADLPRRWLLEDRDLVAIAAQAPRTPEELSRIPKLNPQVVKRRVDDLLAAVMRGLALPEAECPPAATVSRRDAAFQKRVDAAMGAIQARAAELGMDPALVCSRKDLAALLPGNDAVPALDSPLKRGWRARLLEAVPLA